MTINLGVELTAQLLESRADAESLMLDTARVDEITGSTVDADGVEVNTYTPVYGPALAPYFGKCKFQSSAIQEANPEAGGATFTVLSSRVDFPVGSFRPFKGLIATCVTSPLDPFMPGRKFQIQGPQPGKSQATAYRLAVEEMV